MFPYIFYTLFTKGIINNLFYSLVLALFILILINILSQQVIILLQKDNVKSFILLVITIGLYVAFQNLISLLWGDGKKVILLTKPEEGYKIATMYVSGIQIITIACSLILFLATTCFCNKTTLGTKIKAVASNRELADMFGIDSSRIFLIVFVIGSVIAAIGGILFALDNDISPTMGFNLLLYGIITTIIGGVGSTWGLVGGSLLLATAQHLGAYYIDSKWMDAIAYTILILFLIWRPLGFSGKRLKKVEI